ncbi:unnamed protein product [Polarella glacialis]|nr:unnamed protein product [Polarella glacialis]
MRGKAYTGARVWAKFGTEAEARGACDVDEDCDGYHLHPYTHLWYIHPRAAELVEDRATAEFVAFKKRDITCVPTADEEPEGEL